MQNTRLSQVDLEAALLDAASLALQRYVAMGVLRPVLEHNWRELYMFNWSIEAERDRRQ